MKLIEIIFPKYCKICWEKWDYLCHDCKKKLNPHLELCPYCHTYYRFSQTCRTCKTKKNNYLDWLMIAFHYDQILKKLIIWLKYFHKKDLANFLADRLFLLIETNQILQYARWVLNRKIILTYVPSHRYRHYFIKWYNQSKILAQALSKNLEAPVISTVKKIRKTKSQTKLSKQDRENNLNDAFIFDKKSEKKIKWNELIIIVDDITTTGSTLNEIAKIIKKKYPNITVWWAVLGRHV